MSIKRSTAFAAFICLLVTGFVWIDATSLNGSTATDRTYSFDFANCSISDALRRISQQSGVQINTNRNISRKIKQKSYRQAGLVEILRDVLRGENSAVMWNYEKDGLESVLIWVLQDETDEKSGSRAGSKIGKAQDRRRYQSIESGTKSLQDRSGITSGSRDRNKVEKGSVASGHTSNRAKKIPVGTAVESGSKTSSYDKINFFSGSVRKTYEKSGTVNIDMNSTSTEVSQIEGGRKTLNYENASISPPAPPKRYGLEPPPIPPGFNNSN